MSRPVRIATRGSALARAQTALVSTALTALTGRSCIPVLVRTEGDTLRGPLTGGTRPGLFTSAVRDAVRGGVADLAVHSYKDLPSEAADDLVIAAVPERARPFDVLIADRPLADLPQGSTVGTSSPRRAAALRRLRPDLVIVGLRGNVDARLRKVTEGQIDAAVVAAAGLERLGRLDAAVETLQPAVMIPAPAQGALAVECRADSELMDLLRGLDHQPTRLAVTAERAVLPGIGAACTTAVGAYAQLVADRCDLSVELTDHGDVTYARTSVTGSVTTGATARALGRLAAANLLADADRASQS
ncbi:MAG: hydroxymethylbilane synthase [Propioniciclava sp.]